MKQSISVEQLEATLFSDDMEGICIECGAYESPVEPDAENYPCPECGENKVYGLEQAALCGLVDIE